ncbi:unnamed protein product [Cyclocybe aegerita]|uniref:Uncharacterized protein n=1 Tax=Cyclocybe aegerita TaxID=1973307 RepID=A0A8S0WFB1_CYCAE|nr:unnamed protein product [Cyclocybe aegerita]
MSAPHQHSSSGTHPYYPHNHPHGFYYQYPASHLSHTPYPQYLHPQHPQPVLQHPPATSQIQFINSFAGSPPNTRPPLQSTSQNRSQVTEPAASTWKCSALAHPATSALKRTRWANTENTAVPPSGTALTIPRALPHADPQDIHASGPFVQHLNTEQVQHPSFMAFNSLLSHDKKDTRAASEIWWFMKPAASQDKKGAHSSPPKSELYLQ